MKVYLSWQNNTDTVLLPVTPPSFEIGTTNLNEVINVVDFGEYNMLWKTGLKTISFSSFFPKYRYRYCTTDPLPYQQYIDYIEKWRNSEKPVRLIITASNINWACSIEDFRYIIGKTGDVDYSLELKEYRFNNIPQSATIKTKAGTVLKIPEQKRESKSVESEYVIKKGDTLYDIAKRLTGDGSNYKAIAKKNGIDNPNKIQVGKKLVI